VSQSVAVGRRPNLAAAASRSGAYFAHGNDARRRRRPAALHAVYAAIRQAKAALPAWAAPGPAHVCSDGTFWGDDSHWPELEHYTLPRHAGFNVIRPSPQVIKRHFEACASVFRKERAKIRAVYRERMRAFVTRVRLQRQEFDNVGLPALHRQTELICEQQLEIDRRITAWPASPVRTAAVVLCELSHNVDLEDRLSDGTGELLVAEVALRALRPGLTGPVAASVDEFLDNPDTLFHELSFQGGK
jgi:hypothetical protein